MPRQMLPFWSTRMPFQQTHDISSYSILLPFKTSGLESRTCPNSTSKNRCFVISCHHNISAMLKAHLFFVWTVVFAVCGLHTFYLHTCCLHFAYAAALCAKTHTHDIFGFFQHKPTQSCPHPRCLCQRPKRHIYLLCINWSSNVSHLPTPASLCQLDTQTSLSSPPPKRASRM